MLKSAHFTFQHSTAQMDVERAVADLRFGRPVVLKDQKRQLAVLALDCVTPAIYELFAQVAADQHRLFLSAPRAARLGVTSGAGIAVPLSGVGFEDASRLSYALDVEPPQEWCQPDQIMASAAELARNALLLPAMIYAEIEPDEPRFGACLRLDADALGQASEARQIFEIIARTQVPLKEIGDAEFVVFRGGLAQRDQIAIVVGKPDTNSPVPVRIHSSCITGDLFGSLKCDCGDQLCNGLAHLKEAGGGVLLYLDQEGRGTGIGSKMRAYGYQHLGIDTIDADAELGFEADHRRYEAAVAMLGLLSISRTVLFTNNPTKISALRAGGIHVEERKPVFGDITAENMNYLRTKMLRADHMLDIETLTGPC
ncbi:GTP cyclohydrolase II RibA [Cohaesibacter marisflavi]|uniref:GTP cyclohydrolase II RibA n=1 Tax=Cohaesibacter marisflavi TaxID=655353 RepID=UPI0029C7F919|nr:GTP cyclohydrolase II RibA [Cohaesibacter marisflavi]